MIGALEAQAMDGLYTARQRELMSIHSGQQDLEWGREDCLVRGR